MAISFTPAGFWKGLAERITEVNDDNGWDRPEFETLPIKLMLVSTELVEAVEATRVKGRECYTAELADTAIRLLHVLDSIWPSTWHVRSALEVDPFQSMEQIVWPVFSDMCKAVESWRHNNEVDARGWLEGAFANILSISDALDFDLYEEMSKKVEINATRGYLHGCKNSAG